MRLRHSARSHYARYVQGSEQRYVETHRSENCAPLTLLDQVTDRQGARIRIDLPLQLQRRADEVIE